MEPKDRSAERMALGDLEKSMRRARFADQLPEEEQRRITLILTPTSVEVADDSGDADDMGEMTDAAQVGGDDDSMME